MHTAHPTNNQQPSTINCFTDGACSGNPGPGGWAYLIQGNDHEKEGSGGAPHTTNNRMEMMAVIQLCKALKKPSHFTLHTDSQYVLKGYTEWLAGWIKKGWKNSQNKPVENRDLWEAMQAAAAPHTITWVWVRGHTGHPQNERVDALAVAAIPR